MGTDEEKHTPDEEKHESTQKGRVPFLWLAAGLALVLAPASPLLAYVGALWSVLLFLVALYFAKKGYRTRATRWISAFSLVVSLGAGWMWERFVTPEAVVEGEEADRQKVLEDEFERAFEDAKREPGK
ncbi:MAG: hypothetical protein GY822_13430 [Deltaproteobacteria bacterium]|nr:hypothetical protein [Deltaproteobacteria bacterium]